MKTIVGLFLCALGFHAWRERDNGKAIERVCMRGGCLAREKLYADKEKATSRIWNPKKIPMRGHGFEKTKKTEAGR